MIEVMLSPETETSSDCDMRPVGPVQEWAFTRDFENETATPFHLYKMGVPGKGWFSMGDQNYNKVVDHEDIHINASGHQFSSFKYFGIWQSLNMEIATTHMGKVWLQVTRACTCTPGCGIAGTGLRLYRDTVPRHPGCTCFPTHVYMQGMPSSVRSCAEGGCCVTIPAETGDGPTSWCGRLVMVASC